jgi:hypothetical protein
VTVDKATLAADLATSTDVNVSVAPNGYTGTVTLSVTDLPADVKGTFANATLTLDGSTMATAKLTLATATSTAPGNLALNVVATAPEGAHQAAIAMTVNSAITITIPKGVIGLGGTQTNPVKTAFGSYPITITAPQGISGTTPVTVRFYNADTSSHEIHASAPGAGFAHDPGSISPQSMDNLVRHVNTKGTYDFYLHDQGGPATVGRVVVQ